MGDMGDFYREWNEHKKARRASALSKAEDGMTFLATLVYDIQINTPYHWTVWINKCHKPINYWPSGSKWMAGNKVMTGDFQSFCNYCKKRRIEE